MIHRHNPLEPLNCFTNRFALPSFILMRFNLSGVDQSIKYARISRSFLMSLPVCDVLAVGVAVLIFSVNVIINVLYQIALPIFLPKL